METHPIENLMKSTLENLKEMIDINTVIGEPIKCADNSTIIPISKVSFGFASGGSEFYSSKSKIECDKYPFGGGSGSGMSIKPVAFLIIKDDLIRLLPISENNINILDRILDEIPKLYKMFKNDKKNDSKEEE